MPVKALNDSKKLLSDFNETNGAFIDAVLSAPQVVANDFERILS
jgi:hypothetical protein